MAKAVRQPTTFLTQAELDVLACEKTAQAEHMPPGAARNELLSAAHMYRRLGELRGWPNNDKRRMN
jgi:hypothetical protein